MSGSRAKQIKTGKKGKTKRSGNGAKLAHAKKKKMSSLSGWMKKHLQEAKKRR